MRRLHATLNALLLITALIALALAAAPAAADFETGSTAYRTGDFTAAIDEDAEFAEKNLARLANLMSAKQIAEGE